MSCRASCPSDSDLLIDWHNCRLGNAMEIISCCLITSISHLRLSEGCNNDVELGLVCVPPLLLHWTCRKMAHTLKEHWNCVRASLTWHLCCMLGMERNARVIKMAAYAPLLVNVNHTTGSCPTNLVVFDNRRYASLITSGAQAGQGQQPSTYLYALLCMKWRHSSCTEWLDNGLSRSKSSDHVTNLPLGP